jgi:signal transduction histidine kinase
MTDAAPVSDCVSFPDTLDPAAALAGQVAHDLGNVLTVVLGNAEVLADSLAATPGQAALVARILRAAERGAVLLDRLDRFARHIPPATTPTDAGALLAAYAERLAPSLPPGITLAQDVAPGLGPVPLHPDALTLALDELVENALAALGAKGRLWLRAAPGAAGRVLIAVADDGPGMSAEAMRLNAAPTFGAGVAAHRTGLGLAVTARAAASGGGRLVLGARPGGGTEALLDLPGL